MKKIFLLLLIPSFIFSQRVQLSGIPGQKDDMDINDMLKQIMAPYYQEITNLNNKQKDEEIKLRLLQDFRTNIDNFDRVNRYIFGYESAFRMLTNQNSDPKSLAIQVERRAKRGEYQLNIQQLAQHDAFSSAPINLNTPIPAGTFMVQIAQTTNIVKFAGGNILNLEDTLKKTISNTIDVKSIRTSEDTRTLVLSGQKDGINQKIHFDGDLTPLIKSQLLTTGERTETNINWSTEMSNTIISNSSSDLEINYPIEKNTRLTFHVELHNITPPLNTNTAKLALSNLPMNTLGTFSNEHFVIPGVKPILQDRDSSQKNTTPTPTHTITLYFDDHSEEIIPLMSSNYLISLDKYLGKNLTQMRVVSEQALTKISPLLLSTTPDGALNPYKIISQAQDAKFTLDGVEITRPDNTITNLLTGVTLNLLKASQHDITIKIQPDLELIKNTILQWVVEYNNIIEEIYTFTTIPLEKIGKMKPLHEREKDKEDLKEGTFYGNSSLISFKDRLRRLVGTPHNDNPNDIALLDQIGIYVKRRTSFNNDPDTLRKGTLSVDTAELEKMLNTDFDAVHKLFVQDKDGDTIGDIGVAVASVEVDKLMIGNYGFLTRTQQDGGKKIQDFYKRIAKKEDDLERTERKERQSLLQMSQAIAASKAQNESLKQRFGY